jgi:hypothetical protein
MQKILKIFITYLGELEGVSNIVSNMLDKDYVLICGAYNDDYSFDKDKNILYVPCDDGYCGLSEKVIKAFGYIFKNEMFKEYTHFYKLDSDMYFVKDIDFQLNGDYYGIIQKKDILNRKFHFGKCIGNRLNYVEYKGEVSDFCDGGAGYILSRKSLKCISQLPNELYFEPLEDVMIGSILLENGIKPNFMITTQYFNSKVVDFTEKIMRYLSNN